MALRNFSLEYIFYLLLVSSILMFFACGRSHDVISYDNQFSGNNPETHGDPYKLDYEITDEAILLRWSDITGADGVAVFRKTIPDVEFEFIGSSDLQEYVDYPPVDKTYHYQVCAYREPPQDDIEAPLSLAPLSQTVEVPYVFTEEVLIPAGEFQMGSDEGEKDEKPEHTVYLDDFYLEAYEVTNALYKRFMAATGYTQPAYWDDPVFNPPEHPVVGVSWSDAKAYCEWVGKRLPTEAEWEKAARGGSEGKKYVWGDTWPPPLGVGNIPDEEEEDLGVTGGYSDGYPSSTAPVGSFDQNRYGLYDMAGNVWEWCEDWYEENYYGGSPERNPTGPDSGTERVVRSSSWNDASAFIEPNLRVANRHKLFPDESGLLTGFRCARSR